MPAGTSSLSPILHKKAYTKEVLPGVCLFCWFSTIRQNQTSGPLFIRCTDGDHDVRSTQKMAKRIAVEVNPQKNPCVIFILAARTVPRRSCISQSLTLYISLPGVFLAGLRCLFENLDSQLIRLHLTLRNERLQRGVTFKSQPRTDLFM